MPVEGRGESVGFADRCVTTPPRGPKDARSAKYVLSAASEDIRPAAPAIQDRILAGNGSENRAGGSDGLSLVPPPWHRDKGQRAGAAVSGRVRLSQPLT